MASRFFLLHVHPQSYAPPLFFFPREVSYGKGTLGPLFKLGHQSDASSFFPSSSPLYVAPPQTPAPAMRGTESVVMGLLLREDCVPGKRHKRLCGRCHHQPVDALRPGSH
ncbi:hypothetical protein KSP40_PGU006712 [Platanthera guangdongensis]|uniref:Uncharacterized protein n=1 Tax=Platanthera guangdongensis TaxID=2320717 RepID=A0ABR2MED3_9ASPA